MIAFFDDIGFLDREASKNIATNVARELGYIIYVAVTNDSFSLYRQLIHDSVEEIDYGDYWAFIDLCKEVYEKAKEQREAIEDRIEHEHGLLGL